MHWKIYFTDTILSAKTKKNSRISKSMHQYSKAITKLYSKYGSKKEAVPMKKYMRNQFEFFGIKSPLRKEITREFIKKNGVPPVEDAETIIKELYKLPQRELHYFACGLVYRLKKSWRKKDIKLIEWLILHKSWWDTVDFIASNLAGEYFRKFPEKTKTIIKKWQESPNMWLNRSAIIFQLGYKHLTDEKLLFQNIKRHAASDEFFHRKAIGWALREYTRTNPKAVIEFVKNNELKPLSKKEALRRLK